MKLEQSDIAGAGNDTDGRLVVVSNRLPFTLKRDDAGHWTSTRGAGAFLKSARHSCSHQNRHEEAKAAFEQALVIRRTLAEQNPEKYLPNVAMTLNNLGLLHRARGPAPGGQGSVRRGVGHPA